MNVLQFARKYTLHVYIELSMVYSRLSGLFFFNKKKAMLFLKNKHLRKQPRVAQVPCVHVEDQGEVPDF